MRDRRWDDISERIRLASHDQRIEHAICVVAQDIFGAQAVSLCLVIDGAYSPIASSNSVAVLLDETQFQLGDGPTFEASASAVPIVLNAGHHRDALERWPIFLPVAHRQGIESVFAFPLRIGSAFLGVLSAYRTHSGEPTADQLTDGLVLASISTAELIRLHAGVPQLGFSDALEPGVYDQAPLQIAAGMVAESLNISIVAALARIRARAYADDQPVTVVARRIVDRDLILDDSDSERGPRHD